MLRAWIAGTVIRPVTTTMVTIAVLLFGLVAATRLPIELLPDISYPTITVRTLDPDAAPAEIEELVTRPIEERIGAVPGLLRLESVSREGESEIALQFAWGTAIDRALADVREKLDRVSLPITAQRPMVLRYDPAQEPVVRLGLRSKSRTELDPHELAALRYEAERTVKTQLEKIPGVAAVEIHGGEQDEILVELDPERMGALGLDSAIVSEALRRNNINRPGGAVTHGEDRYLIRTLHEATTPRDLGDIIIRSQGGAHLRLRDIADIRRTPGEREELSLLGELEAVELAVYREGDANIVEVANAVTAALPRLRLAAEHELEVLSNRARFIEAAIAEVKNNTLIGGALAVAILLFFLRNLRSTAVIAIAIPVSVLATFLPLRLLGISFNMMSLGGLALGVGMLVDNSIVVLESNRPVRRASCRGGSWSSRAPRKSPLRWSPQR
jgi:HAE1 family hydrophobic/amphiphilic exporter-1